MSYSFSDLNTAQRCMFKYKCRVVYNLQPIRRKVTLEQGTIMHRQLMAGFIGMQAGTDWQADIWTECAAILEESKKKLFTDEILDYEKLVDDCYNIVIGYFEQADWTGWTILHVEEEFSVEIDGETVTFTPDLVARDPDGSVWVFDHKSTTSLPSNGIPFSTQQALLYYGAVRLFYPEVKGFIFNYLRKKRPTMPRLNKTGKASVTDLNRVDTTFEILLSFIQQNAPDLLADSAHKRRLAELRDGPPRFYYTERVLANEAALNTMLDEASERISMIKDAEDRGVYIRTLQDDRGYLSCNSCEFKELCRAELLDWNTDIVMEAFEPRDAKNPYESQEDNDG